jgi:peptide/nickel transport system permease protein
MSEANTDVNSAFSSRVTPPQSLRRIDIDRRRVRRNWPLVLGAVIVLIVLLIALAGPTLAPRDPLEENTIIQVDDRWETPPFPFFAVPGFPLGSDQFGRDLLSRLLWAVRPTLVMVTIVAVVRLFLGTAIGLGAGWFSSQFGHALELVIGAALTVPVLLVALGAIALLGVELGLLAFIIGLSVNGWAETARLVREQTRLIKGQLYIEAAQALGASDLHILLRHVLRQLLPLGWMLFAFEISGTLLATAGLGFLGYYIGGDVWIDVGDFVARRLSGMPELGQMLASAWSEQQIITEPWAMMVAGSVVFFAVLGFNLLGEGLRLKQTSYRARKRRRSPGIIGRLLSKVESRGLVSDSSEPMPRTWDHAILRAVALILLVAAVGAVLIWWRIQVAGTSGAEVSGATVLVPGDNLWAAARHDPYGTLWTPASGPAQARIQWTFQEDQGLMGGPAIAADGTLYLASSAGRLTAVSSDGSVLWQIGLPAGSVGTPALDGDGIIHIADQQGGLSAVDPAGNQLWYYQPTNSSKATTGPVASSKGMIFYPAGGKVSAITPAGKLLWETRAPYGFDPAPPHLNPDESLLFYLEAAFNVVDGTPLDLTSLAGRAGNEQFVVGADGNTYYRSADRVIQWRYAAGGIQVVQSLPKQIPGQPRDMGVTPDGVVWATYRTGYNTREMGAAWFDSHGQVLGQSEFEQTQGQVIAVDGMAILFTCGNDATGTVQCLALQPGATEPLWRLELLVDGKVVGGALDAGHLYVTVDAGTLFALGEQD